MPVGIILGRQLVTWLGDKMSPYVGSFIGMMLISGSVLLLYIPNHSIMLVFIIMGLGFGITNICINTLAHCFEEVAGQKCFARCHGSFSIGTLVSGMLAQPLISWGVSFADHMVIISVSTIIVVIIATYVLWRNTHTLKLFHTSHVDDNLNTNITLKQSSVMWILGLLCFFIAFVEGVVMDQMVNYNKKIYLLSEADAVTALNIFLFTMAMTRILADFINLTRERIFTICLSLVFIGSLIILLQPIIWLYYLGVALLGIGGSILIPYVYKFGAVMGNKSSTQNIAFIAFFTSFSFLLNPMIVGGTTKWIDFSVAFRYVLIIAVMVALILWLYLLMKQARVKQGQDDK
jgi:MFS family permease